MRVAGIIAVFSLVMGEAAYAEPHNMQGAGTRTCGDFANDYKKSPDLMESAYFTWAQGFMTAMNGHFELIGQGDEVRDLNARRSNDQARDIRDYCDKHPLQLYVKAVSALYWSLPKMPDGWRQQ